MVGTTFIYHEIIKKLCYMIKRCVILITLENKTIKWNPQPPAEMASCTRSSDAEVGFPFFLASTSERRLCHKSVPPHSSPDASPSLSPSLSLRCLVYLQTVKVISSFRCDFSPLQNRVVDVSNDAHSTHFPFSRSWFRNDMFNSHYVKIPLPREHEICRAKTAMAM